jgi:hypothetical protein
METIIKIEHPFQHVPFNKKADEIIRTPRWKKFVRSVYQLNKASIGEFGGSRTNHTYTLILFRHVVLRVHRNEYHDRSDAERAAEYLDNWSRCEKELERFRMAMLGDKLAPGVKGVIRDSFGVDFDKEQ